jgi:hypothetical protein
MELSDREARRAGEVIEAGVTSFTAQSYRLNEAPPLGALVRADGPLAQVYGLVQDVCTASIDPARRTLALGSAERSVDDVFGANPQIAKLLRTSFDVLVVGHRDGDALRHFLPPLPPRMHGFVYECGEDEVLEFTQSLDFLPNLLANRGPAPVDEVAAAFLRRAARCHGDPHAFLVAAGKVMAANLGQDSARLTALLRRMQP